MCAAIPLRHTSRHTRHSAQRRASERARSTAQVHLTSARSDVRRRRLQGACRAPAVTASVSSAPPVCYYALQRPGVQHAHAPCEGGLLQGTPPPPAAAARPPAAGAPPCASACVERCQVGGRRGGAGRRMAVYRVHFPAGPPCLRVGSRAPTLCGALPPPPQRDRVRPHGPARRPRAVAGAPARRGRGAPPAREALP